MVRLPMDADILPPSDDRIFKLILTAPYSKPVLMDLISAIIGRTVVDVTVRNNELPPTDTDGKGVRLDVNCTLEDGTQVDLEMQASRVQEFPDGEHRNIKGKSVFYLCELHSSQSAKGVKRYDKLAQSYQVTFCSYDIFRNRTKFVNSYSIRHDEDGELLTDAVQIIFVELNKLEEILKKPAEDMTDLEKWAIFFRYANVSAYRNKVNEVIGLKEELQMAGETLLNVSKDERERAILRSRRMYQTDLESDMATVGDARAATIARRMLAANIPIEQIMAFTELSRTDIERIK